MSAAVTVAGLLALAVIGSWARLGWWQARAPARSRGWRVAALGLGQPVVAALLYLTLFPPAARAPAQGELTVLTRDAGRGGAAAVALPEAGRSGGEQAPDLATALRRHPGTRRLRVLGQGLAERDREAARGLPIAFDPPPLPRGLVALAPPAGAVAPGAAFRVSGEVAGVAGGSATLIDPAGREVARAPLGEEGGFVVTGAARVAGAALFRLRVRGAGGTIVEDADVPVWVAPVAPTRVLFLAGAPGPEVKYWRRWATDAGLTVTMRVAVGAGLALGAARPPLTPATLAGFDLVVVDERSWADLSGQERAAVAAAARDGAGLLLRVTGPLSDAARRQWAALNMPLLPAALTVPTTLRAADGHAPPALTRRVAIAPDPATVPVVRDGAGTALAAWRPAGLGRVGASTLTDDAGLVTAGEGAVFGELWADTVAALARPRQARVPAISSPAIAGERTALCGVAPGARVLAAGGRPVLPQVDPAARNGCAGYWPTRPGWHVVVGQGGEDRPFFVYPSAAFPGVRAAARRDGTLALALAGDGGGRAGVTPAERYPGSSWPWLLPLLAVAGALWWLERASPGRRAGAGPGRASST